MGDEEEAPAWLREYGEEDETAVCTLQRAGRCRLARRTLKALREEEAKRPQNTGWGYDTLKSVYLCNAKSVSSVRIISKDSDKFVFTCDTPVAPTVVKSYEGKLDSEGRYSGQGKATLANGASYEGMWEYGLMHGQGFYKYADGVTYKGPFVMGKMRGKGTIRWPGGNVYEGEVWDGRRHGKGKFQMVMESDEVEDESAVVTYDGMWADGKRHGQGTLLYDSDGKQKYEGLWKDDQRHGTGVMYFRSGNVYSGTWRNGKFHGAGQMLWYNRNEVYIGEWMNGLQHGKGEHVWFMEIQNGSAFQTQNRYKGSWSQGARHGQGVFDYADGSKYMGEWSRNEKHGSGSFFYPDGKCYVGQFENDKMVNTAPKRTAAGGEIVLQIDDVLAEAENPADELAAIKNTLLQYMSELKQIFKYYSQPIVADTTNKMASLMPSPLKQPTDMSRGLAPSQGSLIKLSGTQQNAMVDNAFAISMVDFWKFAKDCRIPDSSLTLAEIDRIFLIADKSEDKDPNTQGFDVHNPSKKLIFRKFVEGIVRLADFKYQDLLPVSRRLSHALYHNILPYACQDTTDEIKQLMDSSEMKTAMHQIDSGLRLHFKELSAPRDTMKLRQLLDLCGRRGYLDAKLSHAQIVNIYYQSVSDDVVYVRANSTNLDVELIYEEFIEVLLRICERRNPAPSSSYSHQDSFKQRSPLVEGYISFLQMFLDFGVNNENLSVPPPPPVPVQLPGRASHHPNRKGSLNPMSPTIAPRHGIE